MGRMGGSKLAAFLTVLAMVVLAACLFFGFRQPVQAGAGLTAPPPQASQMGEAIREARRCMGGR